MFGYIFDVHCTLCKLLQFFFVFVNRNGINDAFQHSNRIILQINEEKKKRNKNSSENNNEKAISQEMKRCNYSKINLIRMQFLLQ